MTFKGAVLVLVLISAAFAFIPPTPISQKGFEEWMCATEETCVHVKSEAIPQIRAKFFRRLESMLSDFTALEQMFLGNDRALRLIRKAQQHFGDRRPTLKELQDLIHSAVTYNSTYPYFAWMPIPTADVLVGKGTSNYQTPCFGSVTVSAKQVNTSFVELTLTMANQLALFCSDSYLILGGGAFSIQEFSSEQTANLYFNISETLSDPAEKWYLDSVGIRVTRFNDGLLESRGELIDTLVMLAGFLEMPLTADTFNANVDFMNSYIHTVPRMQPTTGLRSGGAKVGRDINPDDIGTGDALLIVRPDGLDPMLGWAMGADSGHTTIAMRFSGSKDLFICESTTKDAYWPTNGIQCHPWLEWIDLAEKAQHNTVVVPLSDKYRAMFNASAAADFFHAYKGVDYGYAAMLFSWLDTVRDNFPCVPPDYTTCLFPKTAEIVAVIIDKLLGSSHQNMFRQALAHRVGIWPAESTVLNTLMVGALQKNKTFIDLYQIPEDDSWQYNTTRDGVHTASKSMVCCVFVCNMWKAAGIFSEIGNEISCGEQTNWDIYSMAIFNASKFGSGRPEICKTVDPANTLCQVTGNLTFVLVPDVNSRELYENMGNSCPSKGPQYIRPANC